MAKQDCNRNGERISKLEVRCEEYDNRTKGQLKFIIEVNEKVDKHERVLNLFVGGFSTVAFILSCVVALKKIGVF